MKLIVGLGNPGANYAKTRHNLGFLMIDQIADFHNFPPFVSKFKALISGYNIADKKLLLVKPQTFMNLSGESINLIRSFYKVSPENIIVIHDDIDLLFGVVKMKKSGGSGGHNGIKSLDEHITKEYFRIRVGVGRPSAQMDISNFVLQNFLLSEYETISTKVFNDVNNSIRDWI